MIRRHLFAIPAAILLFSGAGCVVTKSLYDMKAAEADSLRSALAQLNQEKAKLAEENASLSEREAALAGQIKEMDNSLKQLEEGRKDPRSSDERRQISLEQFIENLAESEKTAEQRIRELTARAEACEKDLSRAQDRTSGKPAPEEGSP